MFTEHVLLNHADMIHYAKRLNLVCVCVCLYPTEGFFTEYHLFLEFGCWD